MKKYLIGLLFVLLVWVGSVSGTGLSVDALWTGLTDNSGEMLSGGLVYTYTAGTTASKTLYTDSACTTPAANPVVLDAYGRANVYGNGMYRFVIKTSAGVTLQTLDNLEYYTNASQVTTAYVDGRVEETQPSVYNYYYSGTGLESVSLASTATLATITQSVHTASSSRSTAQYCIVTYSLSVVASDTEGASVTLYLRDSTAKQYDTAFINIPAGSAIPVHLTAMTSFTSNQVFNVSYIASQAFSIKYHGTDTGAMARHMIFGIQ